MIHELIEPKKKTTVKNSASRNAKVVHEAKSPLPNDTNFEQSESEYKEAESSSATFIPPWLRNSLGLGQRSNQSHTVSDQKSARIVPKFREHSHNDFSSVKTTPEHCFSKVTDNLERLSKDCGVAAVSQSADGEQPCKNGEKLNPIFWNRKQKDSETESTYTNAEIKTVNTKDLKMTNSDIATSAENGKFKDEDKRRLKFVKQKNKMRKRVLNEYRAVELGKNEVNRLLEMKARETLDNYVKKDVHSVASDMKYLEAKLILLSTKWEGVDNSKLSQQELQLLQEIKDWAGNTEDVAKLMDHIKESNLKEILKTSDCINKSFCEKTRKYEDRDDRSAKESLQSSYRTLRYEDEKKSTLDKESLMSTDDEKDIKRFGEFLNKNRNTDEKRKCLEEVRNYFERKRRTRLTKRRYQDEPKTPRPASSVSGGKDEEPKERQKTNGGFAVVSDREKKSRFKNCDEEVIEKAVDETLQKFVDIYHFNASPMMLGSMRKNILQAIQSDSLDSNNSKSNFPRVRESRGDVRKKTGKAYLGESAAVNDITLEQQNQQNAFVDVEKIVSRDPVSKLVKNRNFKTPIENSGVQVAKPGKETGATENEIAKRMKKDFENFLNSLQVQTDITGLRIQSVTLEKDEVSQNASSKILQFIYNFTKKALESKKVDVSQTRGKQGQEEKVKRDNETQTVARWETLKKNVKSQTINFIDICEKSLQTDEKIYLTSDTQTESEDITVKELKELSGLDVRPGLYRMVKSKEPGRFYMYPEKPEDSSQALRDENNSSFLKVRDSGTKPEKLLVESTVSKETKAIVREKERGKVHGSQKACILTSRTSRKVLDSEQAKSSLNCLYFRKVPSVTSKNNHQMETDEVGTQDDEQPPLENHMECAWFWNGEKITPGCDLKTHVEDLLKEKLKEISHSEAQCLQSRTAAAQACQTVLSSESNMEKKNHGALFCISGTTITQEESPFVLISDSDGLESRNKTEGEENKESNVEVVVPFIEQKSVRDVGTQNSQQTFLSLNITKLKSRSKIGSVARITKNEQKKKNFIMKPMRDTQDNILNFKKVADIIQAVGEIKNMKLGVENCEDTNEHTVNSGSIGENSTSSSTLQNGVENPLMLILGLKQKPENEEVATIDVKNQMKKVINLTDHECQRKEACHREGENSVGSTIQEMGNCKHWELIERVLNRVNQKEQESLWNDVRELIKTKIGRDINDEGAREVCIEIEQDMSKTMKGKAKHAVLAKGHYARNEGDVEVEIDLTLDDLERLLPHRQKKIRRRPMYRNKIRRLVSSSSAPSDFAKECLRKVLAPGECFVDEKEQERVLRQNKDNLI